MLGHLVTVGGEGAPLQSCRAGPLGRHSSRAGGRGGRGSSPGRTGGARHRPRV